MTDLIPEDMTDASMFAVIVGFFVPLVINFLVKSTWPAWVKSLLAFLVSAIVGTGVAFFAGAYTGLSVPSTILLTFVVAITSYSQFWSKVAPNLQSNVGVGASKTTTKDGKQTNGGE